MSARDRPAGPLDHRRRWLSHHGPDASERCCSVSGVALCRRCSVLYPVAVVAAVLTVLVQPSGDLSTAMMWLLPLPMVAEWTAEHLGWVRYSPTRQVAVTALGAPALGVALGLHALEPFSSRAVVPVLVWGGLALAVALWGHGRRPTERPDWEARHRADEAARRAHLEALLARTDRSAAADGTGSGPARS